MSNTSKSVVHIDPHIAQIARNYTVNSGGPVAMIMCFNWAGAPMLFDKQLRQGVPTTFSGTGYWPICVPFIMSKVRSLSELTNKGYYEQMGVDAAFLVLFNARDFNTVELYKNGRSAHTYVSLRTVDAHQFTTFPHPSHMAIPQPLVRNLFPHKTLTMRFTPNNGCFVSLRMPNLSDATKQHMEKHGLSNLLYGGEGGVDFIPLCHVEDDLVREEITGRALEQMYENWILFMVQFSAWLNIALYESDEEQNITLEFVTMTGHRVYDEIDVREFTGDREFKQLFGDDLASRRKSIDNAKGSYHPVNNYVNFLSDRLLDVFFMKLNSSIGVLFEYRVYMGWKKKYEAMLR